MTEITSIFDNYRECVRHLWNQFYLPIHRNRKGSERWLEFSHVENQIFYDLVLRALGYTFDDFFAAEADPHLVRPFLPFFIVPNGSYGVPALISREAKLSGYWDHDVDRIPSTEIDIRFVTLFDWDEQGFRNYQYFQAKILESTNEQSIKGHYALIDAQYVKIMHDEVRPVR